jgi:DMSO/TMAO reductase YedYZ molybdopterin-dependent catalytic subunit
MRAQRLLMGDALAREFTPAQMSPEFRANGSTSVADSGYRTHLAQGFSGWALVVDGLVRIPLTLPLAALQAMPQRSQITRHDCVEGWSAIGKWQGPQLGPILAQAGLMPAARYVVLHCADSLSGKPYYESIDLIDAFHAQTILAWRMNDQPLAEKHGAPLRLRVERQLGYKQAKYVMRIELRETLAGLYGGKGGYWEDGHDYAWYAGI